MPATDPKPEPEYDAGHVPITEEFDDAKHNLPPAAPVLIALLVVAAVVIGLAFLLRQPPAATGTIDDIFAVEVPQQNSVLCTIRITVTNHFKKPIVIRGAYATLHVPGQNDMTDTAAAAGDFPRYLAAFPQLKDHTFDPLRGETTIPVGGFVTGSIIVAFPVTKDKFDARKSVTATVEIYDHTDVKVDK